MNCYICGDLAQIEDANLVLFSPPDDETLSKWREVLQFDENTTDIMLCNMHFEKDAFADEDCTILNENATPTINLVAIEAIDESMVIEEDDDDIIEEIDTSNLDMAAAQAAILNTEKSTPIDAKLMEENTIYLDLPGVEIKSEPEDSDAEENNEAGNKASNTDPIGGVEPRLNYKYCILCGDSTDKNSECRLFVFPKQIPQLYKKWINASGLEINKYLKRDIYSCQKHFPKEGLSDNKNFIKSWATPMLHLPPSISELRKASIPPKKPTIVIQKQERNKRTSGDLRLDIDSYSKTFARIVMEKIPKKIVYNGEEKAITKTLVFKSNFF
uniref:THAP-type domain-containing protein n=1 Tax=Corethrella appendiculata TaxID=1370023 RepID=U5ELQ2_9DIPT